MLTIVRYGDPVLRRHCKPVKRVDREIRRLMDEMLEAMREEDGIGLAAPQVGIPLRLIACEWGEEHYCLANPRIVRKSKEKEAGAEGCLSLPKLRGQVVRPLSVRVTGLGPDGQRTEVEAEGLLARAFCHEIEHLSGVLFIDRIVPDSLHWLVRSPAEVPGEPDGYVEEHTTLDAAIERLLARQWPGAEEEERQPQQALAL